MTMRLFSGGQFTVYCSLFTLFLSAPRAEAGAQQMPITFSGYSNSPARSPLTNFPVLVGFSNNVGGSSCLTGAG